MLFNLLYGDGLTVLHISRNNVCVQKKNS